MAREKPDHYSQRARREGYPARSVYKLQEIQQKFHILRRGTRVLDVGAAPGSWSKYALTVLGRSGVVVAVDLSPLSGDVTDSRLEFLQGDLYEETVREELRQRGPYNTVMSDAAPATSGQRTVDTARSAALVEHVLHLCGDVLAPGGNVVAKIFQGGEEQDLLAQMRTMFESARAFKPKSCRKESFETYLVGTGRRIG